MNHYRLPAGSSSLKPSLGKITLFFSSTIVLFSLLSDAVSAQQFVEPEPGEQTTADLELESESNILDDLYEEVFSPIENFFDEVYESLSPILDDGKLIFAEVNSGLNSVVTTVLGEIGLANPQAEANSVGWTERSPHANPQTSSDVVRRAEAADTQKSQALEQLSQVIFSQEGQQTTNRQNVMLGQTQEDAAIAETSTAGTYADSIDLANRSAQSAARVARAGNVASSSRVTQDVMKAIAAQNNEIANINLGVSQQLTLIGEAQLYNATQMEGLNTQLTIANQRSQNVQTFLAAQNSQLAEIDSNQELAMKREIERENQARTRDRQGMTRIFIPGLFNLEDTESTVEESTNPSSLSELPVVNTFFSDLSESLN